MQATLFERNKQALMAACRKPDEMAFGSSNDRLDEVIKGIKAEQPECFLTEDDLKARCFVHAPLEGREVRYRQALRYTLCPAERAERAYFEASRKFKL